MNKKKNGEIKKKHESVIAETSITFTYLPSMSVPVLTVSEYILSQDPNEILKTVNFWSLLLHHLSRFIQSKLLTYLGRYLTLFIHGGWKRNKQRLQKWEKRITSTGKNTTPSKKITCYQSVTGRGISKKEGLLTSS